MKLKVELTQAEAVNHARRSLLMDIEHNPGDTLDVTIEPPDRGDWNKIKAIKALRDFVAARAYMRKDPYAPIGAPERCYVDLAVAKTFIENLARECFGK